MLVLRSQRQSEMEGVGDFWVLAVQRKRRGNMMRGTRGCGTGFEGANECMRRKGAGVEAGAARVKGCGVRVLTATFSG